MYLSEWASGDAISYTELIIGLTSNSSSFYYLHISLTKVKLLSVVFIVETNDFFPNLKLYCTINVILKVNQPLSFRH